MKLSTLFSLLIALLLFNGCAEDEDENKSTTTISSSDRGFHFQGRDCLACHNIDLKTDKHLRIGATLFKNQFVKDFNDISKSCNADLVVEFLDASNNVIHSSATYTSQNAAGNKGSGNIYINSNSFSTLLNGSYTMKILERSSGLTLAQSNATSHNFNNAPYRISSTPHSNNRISCNSCHNGVVRDPLYVQSNLSLCN